MEERQVSVDGTPRPLPDPFVVAATQNPIEHEGTYPLPEAQLDRFLLKLTVPLPTREEELGVAARRTTGLRPARPRRGRAEGGRRRRRPRRGRAAVGRVTVADGVLGYVVDLCRATRHVAVAGARRLAARRDRAADHREGVGLAGRPRLRDPRRREGDGPARPCGTGSGCGRRRSWRASPPTPCSTPYWPLSRPRGDRRPGRALLVAALLGRGVVAALWSARSVDGAGRGAARGRTALRVRPSGRTPRPAPRCALGRPGDRSAARRGGGGRS